MMATAFTLLKAVNLIVKSLSTEKRRVSSNTNLRMSLESLHCCTTARGLPLSFVKLTAFSGNLREIPSII